jgi:hypothetical protein
MFVSVFGPYIVKNVSGNVKREKTRYEIRDVRNEK